MNEIDYEKMLDKAYIELPETKIETARFEVPKVMGHIQGNNTIITNIHQIADTLGRRVDHLMKFLLKELATPADLKKNGVIIRRKISAGLINEKIVEYAEAYVLCKECRKPDTKLTKEGNFMFIKCMACGARYSVK